MNSVFIYPNFLRYSFEMLQTLVISYLEYLKILRISFGFLDFLFVNEIKIKWDRGPCWVDHGEKMDHVLLGRAGPFDIFFEIRFI